MKKFIEVRFQNDSSFKTYHFLTDIEGLVANDQVVVDTANGYAIAIVEKYIDIPKPGIKQFKWVIQQIDFTSHAERIEKERRMAALKRKMESRRAQLQEIEIFALLSKDDPGMKDMFDEFLELSK
jgi:hypothetical protein